MGRWLRRYRDARAAAGLKGGPHDVAPSPVRAAGTPAAAAAAADFQGVARRGVAAVADDTANANTQAAYAPKIFEFFEYADHTRSHQDEATRYLVSFGNIFGYVWYHAFRAKRSGGKPSKKKSRKKRKRDQQQSVQEPEAQEPDAPRKYLHFLPEEYDKLCKEHAELDRTRTTPSDPEKGVSYSEMEHVKNALKRLYEEQVSDNVSNLNWDHIWTMDVKNLMLMVKNRKTRLAIKNNTEKMDVASTPYMIVARVKDIEEFMWNDAIGATKSQVHTSLRNRYCYTRSLGTIARGETLHGEELSDHFLLEWQGPKDPHPMEIDVSQVARGKTNQNYKTFSRSTRHKDVLMCGFGAYAFYLFWRFEHSKEFDLPNRPDFTDPSTWFKIKSLVALYDKNSYTKGVKDKNYADYIKVVLQKLGLPQIFLMHIGRKVGAASLELKELCITLLKQFGNWNQSMFDKAYSCKIPLEALRIAADFIDGFYFSPRTVVITANLHAIEETVWPWVEESLAYVALEFESSSGDLKLFTAYAWLTYMKRLKRVLIQDAAFILEYHPERASHPIFKMPLFNTDLFMEFRKEMRESVEAAVSPLDQNMDRVLPGVLQMLRANAQLTRQVLNNVNTMHGEMRSNFRQVHTQIAGNDSNLRNSFGRALTTAGNEFLQGSPNGLVGHSAIDGAPGDGAPDDDGASIFGAADSPNGTTALSRNAPINRNTSTNRNTAQSATSPALPYAGFRYCPNFEDAQTVQKIYDQWHGMNAYKNIPVAGGIAAMELKHKSKWRENITGNSKLSKKFSRWKKIITEVHRLRKDYAFEPQQAITVMDAALHDRKGIVSTFADLIRSGISDGDLYGDLQNVQAEEDAVREGRYAAEEADAIQHTDTMADFLQEQGIAAAVSEESSDNNDDNSEPPQEIYAI